MAPSKYIVYALTCPKCGCPRYVGQSSVGRKRYVQHLRGIESPDACHYKKRWVQSLLDKGLKPGFVILIELPDPLALDAAEGYWIAEMKRRDCPLTNLTLGGCGRRGHKDTPETVERRRQSQLGIPVPQERRDRIAASLKGRPSPKKGRPLTPEQLISHAAARTIPPFKDQHGRVYKTLKECSEKWNIPSSNICHVLKGKRKSVGGLTLTYV